MAIFDSDFEAQKFASYINQETKSFVASYRAATNGNWIVEANLKLPDFHNYYNSYFSIKR